MIATDEISIPTTTEIEADGFITPPSALERTDMKRAKPATGCVYPRCEECDKYHGHYCTVPMVVDKQKWLLTESLLVSLEKRLTELENLVTGEILRSDEVRVNALHDANYTWDDYLDGAGMEREDG